MRYAHATLKVLTLCCLVLLSVPTTAHATPTQDGLVKVWSTSPEMGEGFYDYLYIFADGTFFVSKETSLYCDAAGPLKPLVLGQAGRWTRESDDRVVLVVEQELVARKATCACTDNYTRVPCGVEVKEVTARQVKAGRHVGTFEAETTYAKPFDEMRGPKLELEGMTTYYPVAWAAKQDLSNPSAILNRNNEGARMPASFLKAMGCKREGKKISCAAPGSP